MAVSYRGICSQLQSAVAIGALLHLAVAALLLRGWSSPAKVADVVKPQVVNASLIVMQERRKPAPVQKPKAPKAAPKTQNTATKPAVKQQQVRAEAEAAKALAEQNSRAGSGEQQRQQRLAALGELADAALEQSLQRESVSLMRDEEALAAQSFRAGIYELVRKN